MTIWAKINTWLFGYSENTTTVESVDFPSMTKKQLEEYGRTLGIELDLRHSKKKLIEKLETSIQ